MMIRIFSKLPLTTQIDPSFCLIIIINSTYFFLITVFSFRTV